MHLLLFLGIGAALLYALKPTQTALMAMAAYNAVRGLGTLTNWPRQTVPAMQTGKHYFFTLQGYQDSPMGLAQVAIALTASGWKDIKSFPAGKNLTPANAPANAAPSPHPDTWASAPDLRVSATWSGSPGQMFDLAPFKPLGITGVTMWMSTEDFTAMHATSK